VDFRSEKINKHLLLLVSLCVCIYLLTTEASAFFLRKNAQNRYQQWFTANVEYRINATGFPAGGVDAVRAAFQTWEDVVTANISFTEGVSTNVTVAENDGINAIFWLTNWPAHLDNNILAYTTTWTDPSTGEILDADLQFNGENFNWSTTGETNTFDVQNIAIHEGGNFIGIADNPNDPDVTMYPSSSLNETKKRTLEQDDIDAVSFLYPLPSVSLNIAIVYGNYQQGTLGKHLPKPLTVKVTDGIGDPVVDAFVIFDISTGSGTLGDIAPVLTNADGLAQTTLILPGSFRG
jgi:hypothetical protein